MSNFANRTVWTQDNLFVLRGLNSESVDLIYLDPPFNSNREYAAPVGSKAAGAHFKDTWTLDDLDVAWVGLIADENPALAKVVDAAGMAHSKGMQSYLTMMAVRLLEMKRVLKPTGSIYLHCDPTASHYLKSVMDCVFGRSKFRNEIVWTYLNRLQRKSALFARLHDVLIVYSKSEEFVSNPVFDSSWTPSSSQRRRLEVGYEVRKGKLIIYDEDKEDEAVAKHPSLPIVVGEASQPPVGDVWDIPILNPMAKERVGYPTQKPLDLIRRIIEASTNKGDVVLDPFCGCATACVAAEELGRRWIGIDLSSLAVKLVNQRLAVSMGSLFHDRLVISRTDSPLRTDVEVLPDYKTFKHTLYGMQEGNCKGCEFHFEYRNMTIDHIVPRSGGGTDHEENLQLLCGACNNKKGDRSMEYLLSELMKLGIRR